MKYDSKLIGELADIVQAEIKLWVGFRINKLAKKPYEVIRHSEPDMVDPRVMAAYEKRDDAVKAMQRLPIEAALIKVLEAIGEPHEG
jgi:nickel-dependent lactate racemase